MKTSILKLLPLQILNQWPWLFQLHLVCSVASALSDNERFDFEILKLSLPP